MSVKYESRFPQISRELRPKVATATRRGTDLVAEAARARVPVNTGRLRNAIHVEFKGDADYAVVAGDHDVFYGHFIEFGTTRAPAHPFLVPALEERKAAVTALVTAALRGLK